MSIIKSGTTNTTAYSVDANTNGDLVFIVSESLTAVTVSASANVGIGTDTPTSSSGYTALTINNATNGGQLRLENNGSLAYSVAVDASNVYISSESTRPIRYFQNSVEVMRLASGNVGIGTTNPTTNLYVRAADSDTVASIFALEQYNAAGTDRTILVAQVDAANNKTIFNSSGTNTGSYEFQCGNVNTLFVSSGGALVLKGGDTAANGTGITFPATQSASSNANTLDDYEEGTWTPSVNAGSITGTSITYDGRYTKIGRVVHLYLTISTSVNDLEVGSYVQFSGLPYTLVQTSSGSVTTEDPDLESASGFCQAGSTLFTLGPCGSPASTQNLFCTVVGIV